MARQLDPTHPGPESSRSARQSAGFRISLPPDLPDPPRMKPVAGWRGPSAERSASSWCERARVSVGPGTPEAPPIAPGAAARPGSAPSRLRIRGVLRRRRCRREGAMEVLHPRCAGLDVHKDSVVAAVRLAETGTVHTEVRRFDTTTPGLLALAPAPAPGSSWRWAGPSRPGRRSRRPRAARCRASRCAPFFRELGIHALAEPGLLPAPAQALLEQDLVDP